MKLICETYGRILFGLTQVRRDCFAPGQRDTTPDFEGAKNAALQQKREGYTRCTEDIRISSLESGVTLLLVMSSMIY